METIVIAIIVSITSLISFALGFYVHRSGVSTPRIPEQKPLIATATPLPSNPVDTEEKEKKKPEEWDNT